MRSFRETVAILARVTLPSIRQLDSTEKPALTSELTLVGFPVRASIGHHRVRAVASKFRSFAQSNSVCRSNRSRLAVPTQVLAMIRLLRRRRWKNLPVGQRRLLAKLADGRPE
jgi:hypothetical protein